MGSFLFRAPLCAPAIFTFIEEKWKLEVILRTWGRMWPQLFRNRVQSALFCLYVSILPFPFFAVLQWAPRKSSRESEKRGFHGLQFQVRFSKEKIKIPTFFQLNCLHLSAPLFSRLWTRQKMAERLLLLPKEWNSTIFSPSLDFHLGVQPDLLFHWGSVQVPLYMSIYS